jgi:CubicO group peptidase (beta-lactamase class C family)
MGFSYWSYLVLKRPSQYVVWSRVVEAVSDMKYFDYLQSTVLGPIGLRDNVKMWLADPSNHINDPVTQESLGVG